MNNRLTLNYILFLILSFVVIFGYSYFFTEPVKKETDTGDQAAQQQVEKNKDTPRVSVAKDRTTSVKSGTGIMEKQGSDNTITIETPLYKATVDTLGARVVEWDLKKYNETTEENSPPVNLVSGTEQSVVAVPEINGSDIPELIPYNYNGEKTVTVSDGEREVRFTYASPGGLEISKTITVNPESYIISESLRIRNNSSSIVDNRLYLLTSGYIEHNGRGQNSYAFDIMFNNEVQRIDSKPDKQRDFSGQINWFGFSEQYFIKTVLPESGAVTTASLRGTDTEGRFVSEFSYPEESIPAGTAYSKSWKLYIGPKDGEDLAMAGYSLENAVNYGWVEFLAKIALKFLKMLNTVFHNYGLSIIAITLIFRIAFLPLTLRSMKSMKEMQNKMQSIKPKIDALKEKYKDDKTKQNSELMKLYSSHGVNPLSSLGGCLPLLIQLPVFVALYDVLLYSIEMRHSPFLWMHDLSRPEQLFDIPYIGIPFRILPLLMGVSWFISQKLTPTSAPASESMELQMKMMQFMPIIFTVMFWGLPSGLILYWTISNILSIGQQLYINRRVHA